MVSKRTKDVPKVKVKMKASSLEPQSNLYDFKSSRAYEQSFLRAFDRFRIGSLNLKSFRWSVQNCVVSRLKEFSVQNFESYKFSRRITALQWHPTKPTYLAIGSKFGEVLLRNVTKKNVDEDVEDSRRVTSRHQAITCFSFDPFSDAGLFFSSVDGTVCHWDYDVGSSHKLLDTNDDYVSWYCSVATSTAVGLVAAGDSKGFLTLLDKSTRLPVLKEKIHKCKVNSTEFSTGNGWMLATASVDNIVKIWDVRMLGKDKPGKKRIDLPLHELQHQCPVNSAYFSRTNGGRLLTTDQHMQLRVYSVPSFALETTIFHPHRQFQHLTPIKATWHPLTDLITVGRYPDPKWPNYDEDLRSLDIIDANSGSIETKLVGLQGIVSLNEFNRTGELLASSMGFDVVYWKAKTPREGSKRKHGDGEDKDSDDDDENDANDPPPKRKRYTKKSNDKTKDTGKQKASKGKQSCKKGKG